MQAEFTELQRIRGIVRSEDREEQVRKGGLIKIDMRKLHELECKFKMMAGFVTSIRTYFHRSVTSNLGNLLT